MEVPKAPPGLKARGKRLWQALHESADFTGCPETLLVAEEACFLADEVARLRRVVRAAGDDTRVLGYNKQITSMPEVDDLRKTQSLLLSMLKSLGMPDESMTASDFGRRGANARWSRR